jgi:hypothetical protein
MTGPEHYDQAELRLAEGERLKKDKGNPEEIRTSLAIAQTHATLALAAATAMGSEGQLAAKWREVAGVKTSG